MKPLYEFTESNKETYFALRIGDIMKKIDEKCKDWLEGVFVEKVVPEEIYTRNLLMDLDYLLTEAIWIIEVAEGLKLNVTEHKEYVETRYNAYTKSELGYRDLILDRRYNRKEHRLYTANEIEDNNKRVNAMVRKIMAERKENE